MAEEEAMQVEFASRLVGIVTSLQSGVMVVAVSLGMPWARQAKRPRVPVGGTFILARPSTSDG